MENSNQNVVSCFSLHRYERSDVRPFEQGAPLQEFEGQVYQLHVRGRESGTDMAARRKSGSQLPPVHQVDLKFRFPYMHPLVKQLEWYLNTFFN